MKVAIMQPYFAPYIGYISLIKHSDLFVLFDSVQFIRHGWIERNRVLKQNDGWLYIQVPIEKFSRETLIKDVVINIDSDWRNKILAQLVPYKKYAPHYYKVINILNEVFEKEFTSIVKLNKALLEAVITYLGFYKNLPIFSEMDLNIEEPKAPDEWALNICKAIGNVTEYWNPPGGQNFFDKTKYDSVGIDLKFQTVILSTYNQKKENFEAGLSIIDVLMFNSPEEINFMLDQFELI